MLNGPTCLTRLFRGPKPGPLDSPGPQTRQPPNDSMEEGGQQKERSGKGGGGMPKNGVGEVVMVVVVVRERGGICSRGR